MSGVVNIDMRSGLFARKDVDYKLPVGLKDADRYVEVIRSCGTIRAQL